jgi:tetratricopeptide (TPR) repeat protein
VRLRGHLDDHNPFPDDLNALTWLEREAGAMVVLAEQAAEHPRTRYASWALVDQLRPYFVMRGGGEWWDRITSVGLEAARTDHDRAAEAMMLLSRCQAAQAKGRETDFIADSAECARLARANGQQEIAAYASYVVGWHLFECGLLTEAELWLAAAASAAEDKVIGVRATILNGLGMLALTRGDFEHSAHHFQDAAAINRSIGRHHTALTNRGNRASALRLMGQRLAAEAELTDVLREFESHGDRRSELSTLDELSCLALDRGDSREAVRLATRAYALATILHDPRATAMTACTLSIASTSTGAFEHGAELARASIGVAVRHGYRFDQARAGVALADALARLEEWKEARSELERSADLARRHDYRVIDEACARLAARLENEQPPTSDARPGIGRRP